jgi:hypothetical protein
MGGEMKKYIITVLITFIITSAFWIGIMSIRIKLHELWLISAVKAPTQMALDRIKFEWDNNDLDSAKKDFELFRKQWLQFKSENGFRSNAMGKIMVKYSEHENENPNTLSIWRKKINSQVIIFPGYIFYKGKKTLLKNEKDLNPKDISWIKNCKSKDLFIYQLKRIIDYTNIDIPIFVSPDAALTVISYENCNTDVPVSAIIGEPFDYLGLGDLFQYYKTEFAIDFTVIPTGIIFKTKSVVDQRKSDKDKDSPNNKQR